MTRQARRPFTSVERDYLRLHWLTHGTIACARALNRQPGLISKKAIELKLRKPKPPPFVAELPVTKIGRNGSTLYSDSQLWALDLIGDAYRAPYIGLIDFDTATELRDLVRADRIDEALGRLEQLRLDEAA